MASQIDKVVNSMKQGLTRLNLLMGNKIIIVFDDIKDPGGELYSQLNSSTDANDVPAYMKKRLVHLVSLEDRCKEEQVLVKGEMVQFFTFMSDQICAITSFLEKEINVNRGLSSLLKQKADLYQKKIQLLSCMCKDFVTFPSFAEPKETFLQCSEFEIETASVFEDRYDLSLFEDLEYQATPISGWNDDDEDFDYELCSRLLCFPSFNAENVIFS